MERRRFLVALPVLTVAWGTYLGGAQDVEFLRAWDRAQKAKPAQLTSKARIAPAGEPGTPLVIRGQVFQRDGKTPAPGITVFAYHTDRSGLYDKPEAGPHSWRLKGWALTDREGRFQFETIRPGSYPNSKIAAHVHFSIVGPNVERQFPAELNFDDDPLVTADERAKSKAAGQFGGVRPFSVREGVQYVDFTIRIQ